MPRVLFVPGSLRAASSARALMAALAEKIVQKAEVEIADPGLLPLYNADLVGHRAVLAWIEQVRRAAGVVFVTPEYNYSIPGLLKNAIDWASRPAYESVFRGKPCLVVTVSGGALGGVRAQAHLKYVLNGMLAKVFACREIVVPFANAKVTEGRFSDPESLAFATEILEGFVAELG